MTVHIDTATTAPPIPEAFRAAMRAVVGQVSVITLGAAGARTGLTLTSATSLSTEPPMLIACINRSASAHGLLALGAPIGWQVLGAHQQDVADRFAGRGGLQGEARFDGADWHGEHGAYLLAGAALACAAVVDDLIDRATHTIVIARIISLHARADVGALAYHNGAYLPLG
jgi:flavin reductase (DIM6/NTAB) family NADH-FMN oxidoreductase RutF